MAKKNKLKETAVKIGGAVGRVEGKAMAAKKAATEAVAAAREQLKKKVKAVGKELKESKKHLVRAYEKAKA